MLSIGRRLQRRRTARKVEALRVATEESSAYSQVLQFIELYELAHRQHQHPGQVRGAQVVLFRAMASSGDAADTPFREIHADELLGWREAGGGGAACDRCAGWALEWGVSPSSGVAPHVPPGPC